MVTLLTSLSSEVLLRILGSLEDARDLVRFRQASRRLYNVGGDALLWRDLFVHTYIRPSCDLFARPSLKRQRLSYNADDSDDDSVGVLSIPSRIIKNLPMMQQLTSSSSNHEGQEAGRVDWYTLFKVSRNWQTGNFSTRQLQTLQNRDDKTDSAVAGLSLPVSITKSEEHSNTRPRTLVDSTSSHVFASLHTPAQHSNSAPVLLVFQSKCRDEITSGGERNQEALARFQSPTLSSTKLGPVRISALAVDKGQMQGTSVQLFISYSNGNSTMLYFDTTSNSFHDEIYLNKGEADSVVSAALHSAMLVTCTIDFRIRIYHISGKSLRLIEERRSYCCHWPASLRLEPLDGTNDDAQYRLSIAYSSPVYPIGWTVGLQEIVVGAQSSMLSRSASARRSHVVTCLDSPSKEDTKKTLLGRNTQNRRSQVGRLTSLSYEDPFIVVGTRDNNVVCFKVAGSITKDVKLKDPTTTLELSHVCTFQGHTGTVHSVSLNEGRCVTGGSDGSVRVWRLGDEEAAVAKAAGLLTTIDASLRRGLGKVVTIGTTFASGKRKREMREAHHSAPLSLSEILREAQSASLTTRPTSSSAVVRLVTSAFDHIISVSAHKVSSNNANIPSGSMTCRAESNIDREEEQVQIWNFAR